MDQSPGATSSTRHGLSSILIVDDSEGDALLAEMALLEIAPAASVRHVDTGGLALQVLAEETFDVVLLDLAMPGLTGFDVLDTLAERPPLYARILVLTSSSRSEDRARVARHGVDYVVKDSDFSEFSRSLAAAFGIG